eukprot:gene13321-biopygen20020
MAFCTGSPSLDKVGGGPRDRSPSKNPEGRAGGSIRDGGYMGMYPLGIEWVAFLDKKKNSPRWCIQRRPSSSFSSDVLLCLQRRGRGGDARWPVPFLQVHAFFSKAGPGILPTCRRTVQDEGLLERTAPGRGALYKDPHPPGGSRKKRCCPRPLRVRFSELYRAARVRSASAVVSPTGRRRRLTQQAQRYATAVRKAGLSNLHCLLVVAYGCLWTAGVCCSSVRSHKQTHAHTSRHDNSAHRTAAASLPLRGAGARCVLCVGGGRTARPSIAYWDPGSPHRRSGVDTHFAAVVVAAVGAVGVVGGGVVAAFRYARAPPARARARARACAMCGRARERASSTINGPNSDSNGTGVFGITVIPNGLNVYLFRWARTFTAGPWAQARVRAHPPPLVKRARRAARAAARWCQNIC